jgi:predicted 3-demethylubiquinone-9 3-methyltransferase (glyoxalase superfamily)
MKIAPCLWFKDEAEEAVNFYVSLLPDLRIDHVQRNVGDSLAGKDGEVLVINFTPGGRSFMALNGGMKFQYAHAISLAVDCLD